MPFPSVFRLGVLGFAAALLALAGCVATGQGSDTNGASVAQAHQSLASFQRSLEHLRAGKIERVNILQIGDSHTANDSLSGRHRGSNHAQANQARSPSNTRPSDVMAVSTRVVRR